MRSPPGQEVLDVAAGDGNFALACAAEGASVIASDLSPGMVARGRARAEAEGYDVEWVEADAEQLPFEADRFDCVGSVVRRDDRAAAAAGRRGAVPRHAAGQHRRHDRLDVDELLRRAVRASCAATTRRRRRAHVAEEWGDEDTVRERFDGLAGTLELERRTLAWEADSPEEMAQSFAASAPRQAQLRELLGQERFEELQSEQLELIRRWAGGDGPVSIDAEYLLIVARRRG